MGDVAFVLRTSPLSDVALGFSVRWGAALCCTMWCGWCYSMLVTIVLQHWHVHKITWHRIALCPTCSWATF